MTWEEDYVLKKDASRAPTNKVLFFFFSKKHQTNKFENKLVRDYGTVTHLNYYSVRLVLHLESW